MLFSLFAKTPVTVIVVLLAMVNLGNVTQIVLLYLHRFTQGGQGHKGEE
jgi:hypothetical protein